MDDIMIVSQRAKYGDKITFHGEKAAASGSGDEVIRTFYFLEIAGVYNGKVGIRLSVSKPKTPKYPIADWTHQYVPDHRAGLGAVLPADPKQMNAMTIGYITNITIKEL